MGGCQCVGSNLKRMVNVSGSFPIVRVLWQRGVEDTVLLCGSIEPVVMDAERENFVGDTKCDLLPLTARTQAIGPLTADAIDCRAIDSESIDDGTRAHAIGDDPPIFSSM